MQLCWSSPTAVEIGSGGLRAPCVRHACAMHAPCVLFGQNCLSLFLIFYTTKFSIQPSNNPTKWNMTKKFHMEDDKKNQNGRRPKQFQNIQNCLGPLHAPFGVSFIFSSCTLWKTTSTKNDLDGGWQHWRWGFVSSLARFFMHVYEFVRYFKARGCNTELIPVP